ncbi:MAG TPA: VWA domain-containing protein [Terriglobia bacterium]|nr:VWA domain-containing protein [Terriglobia bacterium]
MASDCKHAKHAALPGVLAAVGLCVACAAILALKAAPGQAAQASGPSPDLVKNPVPAPVAPAAAVIAGGALSGAAASAETAGPAADKTSPAAQITVRQPQIHTRPIQVNVDLVTVGVTVTDPYDRIVTGLDRANFEVFDEKVPQNIVSFSTEDAPISVGMIFDSSGSMSDKIEKSREAALQFFKTSNPEDEFMLINFSERPNLIARFTSKFETLQDQLLFVKSGGKTALLDAIYLALDEMKRAHSSRKALLVISDGGDNHSRYTENEVKRAVRESDTQIYCVGVLEPVAARTRTPEEAGGPSLLSDLSEVSGGRMFSVEDPSELPDIAEKISIELRNEYVIGYKPSNLVRDGRWRRIRVKLDPPRGLPPLQVYARTGYYAPTQ